jgi:hypothetical protein
MLRKKQGVPFYLYFATSVESIEIIVLFPFALPSIHLYIRTHVHFKCCLLLLCVLSAAMSPDNSHNIPPCYGFILPTHRKDLTFVKECLLYCGVTLNAC